VVARGVAVAAAEPVAVVDGVAVVDRVAAGDLPASRVPATRTGGLTAPAGEVGDVELDRAIVEVVVTAQPPVGRTRAVEILRGGRSKVIAQYSYDGLPAYGEFSHLRSADVLGRVDELLAAGTLCSTGGRFPKLRAA